MSTIPASSNPQTVSSVESRPSATSTPLAQVQQGQNKDNVVAAVLFIIALLVLCSLIVIFIAKSSETFRLDTPILDALPETTNKYTVTLEGQGPKKANIEISTDSKSYTTTSDKDG